jgi:adenylate cyclase
VSVSFLNSGVLTAKDRKLMAADYPPTPEAVKAQLDRILQSPEFRAPLKQREFLKFVVHETLEGRASQIKAYTVAVAVYGRNTEFDPQIDPIVRVEAGRLRRALERYYLTAGKNDSLRLEIPKGGYVPTFRAVQPLKPKEKPAGSNDSALPAGPSIAVIPLINLAGDKEQDYFADGLTEELTAELARYQDFQVIASQSTMRLKGRRLDSKKVGKDLGVQFLLSGSVRNDAKAVKVTIRLLDTATAEQIWGESYKRDLTAADLIAVQEEITHRVVGTIADQYGLISRRLSAESRKRAPADLRAYDAVLRFYHYESELTPQAFEKALAALQQAVEIDPEYGLAWAMLGHLHADNHALGFSEIKASLEKALAFAQKGVALSPQNQFARDALTLVYFHQGDKRQFFQHVEQTIALNPNAPYVTGVAGWHMMLYGEWERGLAMLKKGMKLNPYHPSWFHLATYMDCYRRGEYEKALAEAMKFNFPQLYLDPLMRAAALAHMGKENEARTAVGELLKLAPEFAVRGKQLIGRYVKVDDLVDQIIEGLRKAGLTGCD